MRAAKRMRRLWGPRAQRVLLGFGYASRTSPMRSSEFRRDLMRERYLSS